MKKQSKQRSSVSPFNPAIIYPTLLVIFLLFFTCIRLRLLSFPLERDEGEYAYFGQLILQGIPPFKLAWNIKLPGTCYCYALIMAIFGQSASGIHSGLLIFNLGSLIFLYFIVKKLFNPFSALIAVITTGLFFVSPQVLGQAAHATHFVTFFMLGGTLFLLLAFENQKFRWYFLSGVMMGLSFLMKQSGIFFPLFGGVVVILHYFFSPGKNIWKNLMNMLVYSAGVIFPIALLFMVIAYSGVFDRFWFWTFIYPEEYGSRVSILDAFRMFKLTFNVITEMFFALWISAGIGIIALFFMKIKWWNRLFVLLFLLFSFLSVTPGFYFRQHYFISFLPAVGIFSALTFELMNSLAEKHFKYIPVITGLIFIIIVSYGMNTYKQYFFTASPDDLCRFMYQKNYFTEAIPVANYIRIHSTAKDKILVLGSEPEILFYSKRTSATGYIYMYDLVTDQKYKYQMQQEMFNEVEKSKPKYIIVLSCNYSWTNEVGQIDTIFEAKLNTYLQKSHYIQAGIVEYHYPAPSICIWDNDAQTYKLNSNEYISILRRPDSVGATLAVALALRSPCRLPTLSTHLIVIRNS
jgi:hypothetical protein